MLINFIKNLLSCKKRYCPKCGIQMERVKVKSNSEQFAGSKNFLQCPQCKGILMKR